MNFLPEYTEEILKQLMKKKELCPYKTEEELFAGLLPDRLVRLLIKQKDPLKAAVDFMLTVKGLWALNRLRCAPGSRYR